MFQQILASSGHPHSGIFYILIPIVSIIRIIGIVCQLLLSIQQKLWDWNMYTFFSFVTLVSTPWFQGVLFYIKSYDIDTRWLMEREHFLWKPFLFLWKGRSHLQAICSKDGVLFYPKKRIWRKKDVSKMSHFCAFFLDHTQLFSYSKLDTLICFFIGNVCN